MIIDEWFEPRSKLIMVDLSSEKLYKEIKLALERPGQNFSLKWRNFADLSLRFRSTKNDNC
jgi:hypothetical protein